MVKGEFPPGFKVALHDKDLGICQEIAREFHVAMPVVEMTHIHYQRFLRAGCGKGDVSALFREKRGMFLRGKDRPKSI